MHIFLTSAHGWVGSHIAPLLLAKGHTITGLARSDAAASKLHSSGISVLRGDLSNPEGLAQFVKTGKVDAVIHTAFNHDFSKYIENIATDLAVIKAIGSALEGTNKPFITTFGMTMPSEDQEVLPSNPNPRGKSELAVQELAEKGVRAMIVRLPPSVHGQGDYGFVPMLIKNMKAKGEAGYVDSKGTWCAVHVDDAAQLYVDVLEKGKAGGKYHAIGDQSVAFEQVAKAIGTGLNVETKAVKGDEIAEYTGQFLAYFATAEMGATAKITKNQLGWEPKKKGLLEDIAEGHYFEDNK